LKNKLNFSFGATGGGGGATGGADDDDDADGATNGGITDDGGDILRRDVGGCGTSDSNLHLKKVFSSSIISCVIVPLVIALYNFIICSLYVELVNCSAIEPYINIPSNVLMFVCLDVISKLSKKLHIRFIARLSVIIIK
jgi:hypothetical protein